MLQCFDRSVKWFAAVNRKNAAPDPRCFVLGGFLDTAEDPQYDTAAENVKYRCAAKSHVSLSVRSLQEKGVLAGAYREPD